MTESLRKQLGTRALIAYYVSSVVGAGVLVIPGIAAQIAGPASLVAWVLLALVSAPVAIAFAAMAIAVPHSGGVPSFIGAKFNARLGHAALLLLALTMFFSNPVMGFASAHYLRNLLGFDKVWVPLVAYGFLLFSVGFNLIGLRLGSRIQSSVLLLIIVLSLVIVVSLPRSRLENVTPFMPNGLASIGAAVAVCFYSFLGWENVSSVAEEVKDPARTFRRAIPWAIVCVGVLYTSIAWVYLAVVPEPMRAEDPTVLDPILRVAFGHATADAGSALAILLLILTTNSWVLGASRLIFAAARDGLLPSRLATLSPKTAAPTQALLLLAAGYSLVILLLTSIGAAEELLIKLSNASFMLIYLLAFVASLRIFTDRRLRACAWISLAFAGAFAIFFGWTMVLAVLLLIVFYGLMQGQAPGAAAPTPGTERRP